MSIMDIAIHDGSPGLANRIKNYAGIYRTFRQALTVNEADAYIFDDLRLILPSITGGFLSYLERIERLESISILISGMRTLPSILLMCIEKPLVISTSTLTS